MYKEGHLIGNHTYSHLQLSNQNIEQYKQELIKTNNILKEITGEETAYVRPPYGTWDENLENELNMIPVMWTSDSLDWCTNNENVIVQRVIKDVKENDIILMHDYYETSVNAALALIDELLAKGYTFVTIEDIMFD